MGRHVVANEQTVHLGVAALKKRRTGFSPDLTGIVAIRITVLRDHPTERDS